jgi:DNA-directed RNA polymerase subunit RPC12/RpoP
MTQILFDAPEKCPHCGSKNFRIKGDIYNELLVWTHVELKCMRCGTILHSEPKLYLVAQVK